MFLLQLRHIFVSLSVFHSLTRAVRSGLDRAKLITWAEGSPLHYDRKQMVLLHFCLGTDCISLLIPHSTNKRSILPWCPQRLHFVHLTFSSTYATPSCLIAFTWQMKSIFNAAPQIKTIILIIIELLRVIFIWRKSVLLFYIDEICQIKHYLMTEMFGLQIQHTCLICFIFMRFILIYSHSFDTS